MASEKQTLANQRNAQKSTGPRTEGGKQLARFNATKHGLTALQPLLPGEDVSQIELLGESLHDELQPVGRMEESLVERIFMLSWRLQRASRIEMGLFVLTFCEQILDHEFIKKDTTPTKFDSSVPFARQEKRRRQLVLNHITDPETRERIEAAQQKLDEDGVQLGAAYRQDVQNGDALAKLLRYETTIEKSLFRTLHELQRLQAARAGQAFPAPMVVDVNVSSE